MDCIFLNSPLPGEAAFPRRSDHESSTERLPNVGENAQTDLGAARVHPRRPAAEQEPHRGAAMPQAEARLHPEPGVRDQETGELLESGRSLALCHSKTSALQNLERSVLSPPAGRTVELQQSLNSKLCASRDMKPVSHVKGPILFKSVFSVFEQ